jgi:hypothetical protein
MCLPIQRTQRLEIILCVSFPSKEGGRRRGHRRPDLG